MQTKSKIFLLLTSLFVIAYFAVIYFSSSQVHPNEKIKTVKLENRSKIQKTKHKYNSTNKSEEIENKFYREVTTNRYSNDLIIESSALIKEMNNCQSLDYYDKDKNFQYNYSFSDIQQEWISKALIKCQRLINEFPTIASMNKTKLLNSAIQYIATSVNSPHTDLISKNLKYESMSLENKISYKNELAHFIIKSNNAQMILYLHELISDYKISDALGLALVLETINEDYIRLIGVRASLLLSCEYSQGITCSPTSMYMVNNCVKNKDACGLDLPSWFELINTSAHNRDINKVVNYLKKL